MMRPARGFTLVETIFSTLFISLTVLAIVNLFPGAYMSVRKGETKLQSDMIAQSIIDEMRATDFSQHPYDKLSDAAPDSFSEEQESFVRDGTRYFPTITVYNIDGMDPKIVKGLRVEVEYSTATGQVKTKSHAGTSYRVQTNVHETYVHSLRR